MGGHEVDPLVLRDLAKYISNLATSFEVIRIDAQHEGLSVKGFTGLLAPIGDSFSAFGQETLGPLAEMATTKMNQMADSLLSAAEQYGLAEAEAQERIERPAEGGGFSAV
ncbi:MULTISPECIES: hypothetical protein [Prauserella salsuginis group]|uniref:ESX-1 secretion-associated protein n=1 Tax=Prauserella salsuginis TaxID=387889 RepID=A0ABW6G2M7_9PSEU|nr:MULTISPECIES: hypothetical protein [Prauserella salsuginis group]